MIGRVAISGVLGLGLLGWVGACSSGVGEATATTTSANGPSTGPSSEPEPDPPHPPMRVLVTGFNDWRELGDPPNLWRCRDNPSCRLLLGDARDAAPSEFAGPLVTRLAAGGPAIEWRFATMPVTWGAFAEVPSDVDVIVNVGLGVYDRLDAVQLEAGAYNLRAGADAAALERPGPIAPDAEAVLAAPADSPIAARLAGLAGQTVAGYEVLVAPARPANSYLCNETHFFALSTLADPSARGQLDAVYFLHIPYADAHDYEALADAVAGVILGLVREPPKRRAHRGRDSPDPGLGPMPP
jgi:hypothetical protein